MHGACDVNKITLNFSAIILSIPPDSRAIREAWPKKTTVLKRKQENININIASHIIYIKIQTKN